MENEWQGKTWKACTLIIRDFYYVPCIQLARRRRCFDVRAWAPGFLAQAGRIISTQIDPARSDSSIIGLLLWDAPVVQLRAAHRIRVYFDILSCLPPTSLVVTSIMTIRTSCLQECGEINAPLRSIFRVVIYPTGPEAFTKRDEAGAARINPRSCCMLILDHINKYMVRSDARVQIRNVRGC